MHNADYTAFPNYQQHHYPQSQNPNPSPNPIEPLHHAPPSYASAPPVFPNNYAPPPPPSAANYSAAYHNSPSYPSFPQNPDPAPTAPSYSQPQSSYSFPQFEGHGPYQSQPPSQSQSPSYHSSYDQPAPNYTPKPNPNYSSAHPSSQYSQLSSTLYDNHDINLNRNRSDLGSELYGKRAESEYGGYGNDSLYRNNDGVYAYKGSSEPYGAHGTAPKSSTWSGSGFDDFGRPIGYSSSPSGKERPSNSGFQKQMQSRMGRAEFRSLE